MTRHPSPWPKLTRKDKALREGIGLHHIALNTVRSSDATARRPPDLLPVMSSYALNSARLLPPPASNSTADVRTRAFSP